MSFVSSAFPTARRRFSKAPRYYRQVAEKNIDLGAHERFLSSLSLALSFSRAYTLLRQAVYYDVVVVIGVSIHRLCERRCGCGCTRESLSTFLAIGRARQPIYKRWRTNAPLKMAHSLHHVDTTVDANYCRYVPGVSHRRLCSTLGIKRIFGLDRSQKRGTFPPFSTGKRKKSNNVKLCIFS